MTDAPKKKPARKSPVKKTPTKKPAAKKASANKAATTASKHAAAKKATTTSPHSAKPDAAKTAPPFGPAQPAASPPASSSGGGGLTAFVAVVVLAGVGWATYPQWSPVLETLKGLVPTTEAMVETTAPAAPEPAASVTEPVSEGGAEPVVDKTAATEPIAESTPTPSPEPTVATPEPELEIVPTDPVVAALQQVTEKLAAMEARLAQLEQTPAPTTPDVTPLVAPLAKKVSSLESTLASLDTVSARLQSLEEGAETQAQEARAHGDPALSFALNNLSTVLRASAPYRAALDVVQPLVTDAELRAVLDALQPHADTGVATREQLVRRFDGVAAQAARVRPVLSGDAWWEQALNRVASLVSVRKITADGAPPLDAALVMAEAALRSGDVTGALKALDAIEGPSADAMADWRASARARLAIEAALAALPSHGVRLMTASPNATAE